MKNNDKIKRMNSKDLTDLIRSFRSCNTCPAAEDCLSSDLICSEVIDKWLNKDETIYHIECKDKETNEVVMSFDVKKENLKVKEDERSFTLEAQFGFNKIVNKPLCSFKF